MTNHIWKVKNYVSSNPRGHPKEVMLAEATLSWQSDNAVAQNKVLTQIAQSQDRIKTRMNIC